MAHELTKMILVSHVVELIAEKYKVSVDEARDRLYHTPVIKYIEDDETGLYGESPLYCFSLYEPYSIIEKLKIKDLHPSQLYISSKKLDEVSEWMEKGEVEFFEPIPIVLLDNEIIMTDGHTRAVAAIKKGLTKYPLIWDTDELSWDLYRKCVSECKKQGITSPYDLLSRIVDKEEYDEKWNKWCDSLNESK